jgi:hypothetical protein
MKLSSRSRAAIAAAATAFVLTGVAVAPAVQAKEAKGHCIGAHFEAGM